MKRLKKVLQFLLFLPLIGFTQTNSPCFSVSEYQEMVQAANPSIAYPLIPGWNMVGYMGSAENNEIEAQLNASLSSGNAASTFQVIKNVSGQFWSINFAQLTLFTQGEGYMMYVIAEPAPVLTFINPISFPILNGCMDPIADNYNPNSIEPSYCEYLGCTHVLANNYNPEANQDDGTCIIAEACPYDIYVEYSADAASYNANLCQTLIVLGCTDNIAENYNSQANTEDNTCTYILGCTESNADNYNTTATQNDGTCIFYGCMDAIADNYNAQATDDNSTCIYYGCTNPTADNYSETANTENNTCIIYGCTLAAFPNYNSQATTDDFSCDMESTDVFGCTDSTYTEYNTSANQSNGSCSIPLVLGCLDTTACTYDAAANTSNNTCTYAVEGYDCEGNLLPEIGTLMHGGMVFYVDESGEHGLVAAIEDLEGTYEWGCNGTSISGADGQAIGTGYQNTLDIVAGCSESNTAAFNALISTTEGYTDWYLPSKDELLEMYSTIGNGSPEGNIGGFSGSWYWSSSEFNNYLAWCVYFGYDYLNNYDKDNSFIVRLIRAF